MKSFGVDCGGGKGIVTFEGDLLGLVTSGDDKTMLAVYKTRGGKFVCEKVIDPRGECRRTGAVCDKEEQVFKFFRSGPLAQALYEMANLNRLVTRID